MLNYQKVLVAVDLADQSESVAKVISQLLQEKKDVHVCTAVMPIEMLYSYSPMGSSTFMASGLQKELNENAQANLLHFVEEKGIKKENGHVLVGKASDEIKQLAEDEGFDLIVVGTHGKSALRSVLGSTSNGVLHGAPCDVLAIKY